MTREKDKSVACRFGENLKRERHRSGKSQEALARHAGLHRTAIGFIENGERLPGVDTLMQLAKAMNVSPMVLLDGIEWVEPKETVGGKFNIASD